MPDSPALTPSGPQAVWLYPCLRQLTLLCESGWRFLPIEGDAKTAALEGFKTWPAGWRDCIRVREETDALGLRIRVPGDKHTSPEITWEHSGTLDDVCTELLTLPAPETRHAPSLVIGSAPRLWTP